MYAIIESGGKQYRVAEGDTVMVERLPVEIGDEVSISSVLAVSTEGEFKVGQPYVSGAVATATVVDHGRGPKTIVFKYKSKIKYRKKRGHRQEYTKLRIDRISG